MDKCMVLVESWQMQCCGDPFNLRDTVDWLVKKWDSSWAFNITLGMIDSIYEYHSSEWQKLFKITGKVTQITALYCSFIPDPDDPKEIKQIRKYGEKYPVINANGWEKNIGTQKFTDYIVWLENVIVAPAKESEVTFK